MSSIAPDHHPFPSAGWISPDVRRTRSPLRVVNLTTSATVGLRTPCRRTRPRMRAVRPRSRRSRFLSLVSQQDESAALRPAPPPWLASLSYDAYNVLAVHAAHCGRATDSSGCFHSIAPCSSNRPYTRIRRADLRELERYEFGALGQLPRFQFGCSRRRSRGGY